MALAKAFKSRKLKHLTQLVEDVCQFENQIMWDISLNPYKPHNLGWFSYNDGGHKIEHDNLHNFVVTKYYRSLQYYGRFYIIATNDDYSVFVKGRPDDNYEYIKHDSGLYISHSQ